MIVARYILGAAVLLIAKLFVVLASPVLAVLAARRGRVCAWMTTPDDDVFGSKYNADLKLPLDLSTMRAKRKAAGWWLRRNPAMGLALGPLGIPAGVLAKQWGDKLTGLHYVIRSGGRDFFFYQRDWHYGWSARYCKLELGWDRKPYAGRHRLEFDINPFKKD